MQMQPGVHILFSHAFSEEYSPVCSRQKEMTATFARLLDTLARRAITPNERKHVYELTQENGRDAR